MLGKSDPEQLAFSASISRCILTHNRVDYEKLNLHYMINGIEHSGIIVIPQKPSHEIVSRTMVLLDTLTADELSNQLLYI
ncbi:MAG: DUF5615 family PIN-like protein [Pseudanabaena sp. ELA645]